MRDHTNRAQLANLALGFVLVLCGLLLRIVPFSSLLSRLSPDGGLETQTAGFLDRSWLLCLGLGALFLLLGLHRGARAAFGACVAPVAVAMPTSRQRAIVLIATAAFVARLVVGHLGDPSIGDDGARNFWLRQWLADPTFIDSGLWAPGHLYVQALFSLVLPGVEWAGTVVAALAYGATILILGVSLQRVWGGSAAVSAALLAAILPVSMAYGSVADVNTFFAFTMVAAVAATQQAVRTQRWIWLGLAWLSIAFAAWTRFEAFLLAPAVAILLWPRWRVMLAFGAACLLPTFAWNFLNYLSSGDPNLIYNTVRADSGLAISRVSAAFGLISAVWQAITLPVLLLGVLGMLRALWRRDGREWMGVALLHLMVLAAVTVVSGTGYQARYMILIAVIFAAYAGVAIGGVAQRAAGWATGLLLLALVAVIVLPAWYPDHRPLWIRQDDRLRSVMACVTAQAPSGDLVWISDEAAFMYPSHSAFAIERYHTASRADSDLASIATALDASERAWVCVRDVDISNRQVRDLLEMMSGEWERAAEQVPCHDYFLFELHRRR